MSKNAGTMNDWLTSHVLVPGQISSQRDERDLEVKVQSSVK